MKSCREIRSVLLDSYYGDLPSRDQERVRAHLDSCPRCEEEFEEIRFTLEVLKTHRAQDPSPEVLERSWERVQQEILLPAEPSQSSRNPRFSPAWWLPRLAFYSLLIVSGIWLGWNLRTVPQTADRNPQFSAIDEPAVPAAGSRLQRHLQRSEVLILEIMNFQAAEDDQGALGLELSRTVSEQLLVEGDQLRSELEESGELDENVLSLIGDLELILLQIAHLGDGPDSRDVIDALRIAIQQQALLLRIQLTEILEKMTEPEPDTTAPDAKSSI